MRQWPGGPVFSICLSAFTCSCACSWILSPSGLVLMAAFPPPPPHPSLPLPLSPLLPLLPQLQVTPPLLRCPFANLPLLAHLLLPSPLVLAAALAPSPPHPKTPPHLPFLRHTLLRLGVTASAAGPCVDARGGAAAAAAVDKSSRSIASPAVASAVGRDDRTCCWLSPS